MEPARWTHSLTSRIVISYSLILILGGLSTSIIGIHVTGQALLQQAGQQTAFGLSLARTIYSHRTEELRQVVDMVASSTRLQDATTAGDPSTAAGYLDQVRREHGLDFLSVTDAAGEVILRTSGLGSTGDNVTGVTPIDRALQGDPASGTELIPLRILQMEGPDLAEQTVVRLSSDAESRSTAQGVNPASKAGMALLAAAPVRNEDGRIMAVVYAGQVLNESNVHRRKGKTRTLVDQIDAAMAPNSNTPTRYRVTATVFQDDVRVSTTVVGADGRAVVGTQATPEVYAAVMRQGGPRSERALIAGESYITAYEPITNLAGERIGMLAVGLSTQPFTAVRDRVTLSFAGIALFCFLLIVVVTYFLTRSLVRPVEEMVSVSQSIAAGDLSRRVRATTDRSELGLLSASFNNMLDRISRMKVELEEWGKTLEQKVQERSEQLSSVQAQAARQERLASVGQLAAGVAHEINNPLGGILTFASLVAEDLRPDDSHREDLEEIVRQAVRCRKIVTGLLEFSRQRETDMAPANVNQVLARTLALLETQAIFHDVKVARRFDPNMPTTVMDESQMQQVFMNIILNAVDAMDGHGSITIETRHSKERGELLVRISDTGCGIPDDIRESIFDPFFTTKDPGKGTGLGLAVAWKIVQAHGGRTEVESTVGKGTVFTILLPFDAENASTETSPNT